MRVKSDLFIDSEQNVSVAKQPANPGGRRTKAKRMLPIGLSLVLGLVLVIGGIWAFMSDAGGLTNTFTVGDVHVKAYEPNMPTEDKDGNGVPDECELLVPLQEILKDPRIENTGTNDVIVFFRVTVPAEELNLIDDDGHRSERMLADIFWMKQEDDPASLHENHFDENWVELTDLDHQLVKCEGVNDEGIGYTYIFGYHTRLKSGEVTTALFDKIQNKKYGSRTISANEVEQIKVEPFAIQANCVYQDGVSINTEGELGKELLTYVYKVFINQNDEEVGVMTW